MKAWPACALLLGVAAATAVAGEAVRVSGPDALREALRGARAGTSIFVAPGEYPGYFSAANLHGTAEQPIVVAAADPAQPPVFRGAGGCIHLRSVSHVVLRGLVLAGARSNGLNIDDGGTITTPSHHLVLEDLTVRDVGPRGNCDGIKLSGVDDFLVRRCTVERWGSGGSAADMVGCHRGVIMDSTFRHTSGSSGVQAKGGSCDVVVYRCRFVNAGQRAVNMGGSTGLPYFRPRSPGYEAKRIAAIGNTFIGSMAPVAFVGSDECVAAFNTIYRPTAFILRILQESRGEQFVPSRNGVFRRNIIVWRSREVREMANIGPNTAPTTFRFENNWWYCEDRPTRSQPALPTADQSPVIGQDPSLRVEDATITASRELDHGAGSPRATEEFARTALKLAPWAFAKTREPEPEAKR
ncbi:MAG TPA: right-handed parallel beta-helix repeat-containing protein [Planctomycetota bacterium]|nr:right-handed parallel beta-helix repeat-containing protein [Planctomycetota bacterium]